MILRFSPIQKSLPIPHQPSTLFPIPPLFPYPSIRKSVILIYGLFLCFFCINVQTFPYAPFFLTQRIVFCLGAKLTFLSPVNLAQEVYLMTLSKCCSAEILRASWNELKSSRPEGTEIASLTFGKFESLAAFRLHIQQALLMTDPGNWV